MPTSRKKHPKLAVLIGVLLVVLGIATFYTFLEATYQNNIADMKNVISNAEQEILLPNGGREHWPATVTHGANLLESFCVDTNCPQVEAYWYVPLPVNGYNDFENKVTNYVRNKSVFRQHNWDIQVYHAEVSSSDIGNLPKSPAGTTWQGVHVFLYNR